MKRSTDTCMQTVACNPMVATDWAKNLLRLMKAHIVKLNKLRVSLISCPFPKYLSKLDEMLAATSAAQNFVRAAGVYFKRYTNLQEIHDSAAPFRTWLVRYDLKTSYQVYNLLTKSLVLHFCQDGEAQQLAKLLAENKLVVQVGIAASEAKSCQALLCETTPFPRHWATPLALNTGVKH